MTADRKSSTLEPAPSPSGEAGALRRLLLALILFGSAGLLLELALLGHYESPWQWAPVGLLIAGLVLGTALWVRPGAATLRGFRLVMLAMVAASVAGMWIHFDSNLELEREMDAAAGGGALFWYAVRGATPTLAPGALAQIGLLGLILTFRHPAARPRPRD